LVTTEQVIEFCQLRHRRFDRIWANPEKQAAAVPESVARRPRTTAVTCFDGRFDPPVEGLHAVIKSLSSTAAVARRHTTSHVFQHN